jgi:L-fuculose-phosphate aldolase
MDRMSNGQGQALRQQICEIGRRLYDRGHICGSEGNISARLGGDCLCTPSGISKGFLRPEQVALIDMEGKLIEGPLKATSESPMHTAIYLAQSAARAVVHAHPPYATALGVAGVEVPPEMLNEGRMFLGTVPLLPFELPGTPALAGQISKACQSSQAIMMKNHGALTWSDSLEDAWMLMEMLEAMAKVTWLAKTLGRIDLIPAAKCGELRPVRRVPLTGPKGTP